MPRPPKFSEDDLLDAAAEAVLVHWRGATIAHVSEISGAPVGSIYHRFGSRDELFGMLWARSVRRFHAAMRAAIDDPDPQRALEQGAVCIPRFCRDHPLDAKAMTLYRLRDLVDLDLPRLQDVSTINDDLYRRVDELVARRWGEATEHRRMVVGLACQLAPYGLVRPWIGEAVPPQLDDAVLAAARGILALG